MDDPLQPVYLQDLPSVVCMYARVLIASSYKDISYVGLGLTHIGLDFFYFHYLFKEPISKYSHIMRYWELRFHCKNFGETQFSL